MLPGDSASPKETTRYIMLDLSAPLLDQLSVPDPRRALGETRQAAVWRGEQTDYLPLLVEAVGQPWDGQVFTLPEQVADPDKMLHEALLNAVKVYPAQSDSVLSIRPQFGVGSLASVFGVEYELSARYGSPWVTRPLSKSALSALTPDTLDWERSLVPALCRYLEHFRRELNGRLEVYLADTQGPFDLAHLARGHDLLTDLVDDPPFVHHLMEVATHVYIEGTRRMKQAAGEPLNGGHHSGNLHMVGAGVRLCDDSGTIISPRLHEEFVLPYQQRALAAFGGGWVHWCGGDFPLVPLYLSLPACRGINLGQPQRYDLAAVFEAILEAGKLYYGCLDRKTEESLGDYFKRVLGYLQGERRGLILVCGRDDSMPPVPQMMDLWHEAH